MEAQERRKQIIAERFGEGFAEYEAVELGWEGQTELWRRVTGLG